MQPDGRTGHYLMPPEGDLRNEPERAGSRTTSMRDLADSHDVEEVVMIRQQHARAVAKRRLEPHDDDWAT